jgi:hypothetical protein
MVLFVAADGHRGCVLGWGWSWSWSWRMCVIVIVVLLHFLLMVLLCR